MNAITEQEKLVAALYKGLAPMREKTSLNEQESQTIAWATVSTLDLLKQHWLKDIRTGLVNGEAKTKITLGLSIDFSSEPGSIDTKIVGNYGKWDDSTGAIFLRDAKQFELPFVGEARLATPEDEDNDEEEDDGDDEDDGTPDLT